MGWKYLSMDTEGLDNTKIQSMKKILCEALKVFGQVGMYRKRNPNLEIICINFEGDDGKTEKLLPKILNLSVQHIMKKMRNLL